jgi:hypothetical protein
MSDTIKTKYKKGATNREINESIKDVMAMIIKNREDKAQVKKVEVEHDSKDH